MRMFGRAEVRSVGGKLSTMTAAQQIPGSRVVQVRHDAPKGVGVLGDPLVDHVLCSSASALRNGLQRAEAARHTQASQHARRC